MLHILAHPRVVAARHHQMQVHCAVRAQQLQRPQRERQALLSLETVDAQQEPTAAGHAADALARQAGHGAAGGRVQACGGKRDAGVEHGWANTPRVQSPEGLAEHARCEGAVYQHRVRLRERV